MGEGLTSAPLKYRGAAFFQSFTEGNDMSKLDFQGTITKVSPDGSAAVVRLDEKVSGKDLAVISTDTAGRIKLMNGVGALKKNTKVIGTALAGPDALRAISIRKVPNSTRWLLFFYAANHRTDRSYG
mgnify:CR=1 FL=1